MAKLCFYLVRQVEGISNMGGHVFKSVDYVKSVIGTFAEASISVPRVWECHVEICYSLRFICMYEYSHKNIF